MLDWDITFDQVCGRRWHNYFFTLTLIPDWDITFDQGCGVVVVGMFLTLIPGWGTAGYGLFSPT